MNVDDLISVSEAAAALDVDERAVRFMAASGEVDAIKRGRVWWIDRRAVERRGRHRPGPGRPLSAAMAWSILLLASGREARDGELGLSERQAARARRWLEGHALAEHAPRLRARARREAFDGHPSELPRVAGRSDVMATGISGAREVGVHGVSGEVEVYAPAGRRAAILRDHGLEPRDGRALIRWVADEIWPVVRAEVAPRAAVLLDLLEHDDPRARREAARALARP